MGTYSSSFPYAPLWLLALVFFASLIVAREVGAYVRRRRGSSATDTDAFAMTSVLGLFALLIGFTFSIALSRYEERRVLVVKEANALGTTWLRTQLLDSPDRERMQAQLRRYVDARLAFGKARNADEELQQQRRTEALQNELWTTLMSATASFRDTPRASLLVSTTNDSIDLAAERFATRQAHVPPRILRMLWLFALLAAAMAGYERASHRRSTTLLLALFTLAAALVIDLDRLSTGMINVPQQPMLDLRDSMGPGRP